MVTLWGGRDSMGWTGLYGVVRVGDSMGWTGLYGVDGTLWGGKGCGAVSGTSYSCKCLALFYI